MNTDRDSGGRTFAEKGEEREGYIPIILLCCAALLTYLLLGTGTSADSRWSVPAAMSLVRNGDLDLNEYVSMEEALDDPALEVSEGRIYSIFPAGPVLLASPLIWTTQLALDLMVSLDLPLVGAMREKLGIPGQQPISVTDFYWRVEQWVSSIFMAFCLLLFYFLARYFASKTDSLIATAVLGFCTSAWSIGSTALWQHGPSMLLLTAMLLMIMKADRSSKWLYFAGACAAFSFVVRPTNAVPIMAFSLFTLIRFGRDSWKFFVPGLVTAIVFAAVNIMSFGSMLQDYYMPGRIAHDGHFFQALAGNIISPSRGLLVYSPVLALSLWGTVIMLRERKLRLLALCLSIPCIIHWIVISLFPHWWGGVCYGPRFFSDMVPFMVVLMLPAIGKIMGTRGVGGILLRSLFLGLAVISVFMHFTGATRMDAWEWNLSPVSVDEMPSRLWDWNDTAFLRPWTH